MYDFMGDHLRICTVFSENITVALNMQAITTELLSLPYPSDFQCTGLSVAWAFSLSLGF